MITTDSALSRWRRSVAHGLSNGSTQATGQRGVPAVARTALVVDSGDALGAVTLLVGDGVVPATPRLGEEEVTRYLAARAEADAAAAAAASATVAAMVANNAAEAAAAAALAVMGGPAATPTQQQPALTVGAAGAVKGSALNGSKAAGF